MISLCTASPDDLAYITETQHHPEVAAFVGASTDAEITAVLDDPAEIYVLAIRDTDGARVGYAHLRGLGQPARSIELYRLAISERGAGIGTAFVRLLMAEAFGPLNANRFWLDVFPENGRARHVYRSLGFQEEGLLRDAYIWHDRFQSTIVMSVLAREFAAGLDSAATGR